MQEENQSFIQKNKTLKIIKRKYKNSTFAYACNVTIGAIVLALIALIVIMLIQNQLSTNASSETKIQFLQKHNIQKPLIDQNQYIYKTLENGIKVLLIHNSNIEISKAALSVRAGSFQEPDDYPGLAHFLEHMLFEGSQTYPEIGYFTQLIQNNGGDSNAYTDNMETNYYFQVGSQAFDQSLDVFSHFFIDPSLDKEMLDKEVQAVNSEFEIATSTDAYKVEGLLHLLSEDHPYSRFNYGNTESLNKFGIENELRNFFDNYYSSNLMSLILESNLSLEQLQKMSKKFEGIKNNQIVQPSCKDNGKPFRNTQKLARFKQNSESNSIYYVYQVNDVQPQYKGKPLNFINQLLKSKEKNTLYDYLTKQNLAIELDSYIESDDGNGCFSLLVIEVTVNEVDDYLTVAAAIQTYFEKMYAELFEDQGDTISDTKYLRDLWKDVSKQGELQFNFLENPTADIQEIAKNLNLYDHTDVFSATILFQNYSPEQIYGYLVDLLDSSNLNILIGDKTFQGDHYQKLYNVEYTISDLKYQDIQVINSKEKCKFEMPTKNEYLPHDTSIKSICEPTSHQAFLQRDPYKQKSNEEQFIQLKKYAEMVFSSVEDCKKHEHNYEMKFPFPEFLIRTPMGKLWWKLDRSFQVPNIFLGIKVEKINLTPTLRQVALLKLYEQYTSNLIAQSMNQAMQIGYQVQFQHELNHLSFILYGWSDGFQKVSKQFIEAATQKHTKYQNIFDNSLKNLQIQMSEYKEQKLATQLRLHYLPYVLNLQYISPQQIQEELKSIKYEDLNQFKNSLFDKVHFNLYLTGNILRNEALDQFKLIEELSSTKPQADYTPNYTKILKLSKNYILPFTSQSSEENDLNGATLNYYIFGKRNRRMFAIMNLLKGAFDSQAFVYLRTDLQLGYYVRAAFTPMECLDGAQILVQGSQKSPWEVNQHIEEFLVQFQRTFQEMDHDDFQTIKQGAISQLNEKQKSLFEAGFSAWQHIQNNDYVFEEKEITIDEINLISKSDILEFFEETFKKAEKVSVQLYGKGMLKDLLKNGESLHQYLKRQNPINNFAQKTETLSSKDEIKIGAYVYQCSYKLTPI